MNSMYFSQATVPKLLLLQISEWYVGRKLDIKVETRLSDSSNTQTNIWTTNLRRANTFLDPHMPQVAFSQSLWKVYITSACTRTSWYFQERWVFKVFIPIFLVRWHPSRKSSPWLLTFCSSKWFFLGHQSGQTPTFGRLQASVLQLPLCHPVSQHLFRKLIANMIHPKSNNGRSW